MDSQLNRFVSRWWIFSLVGALLIGLGIWVLTRTNPDFAGLSTFFILLFIVSGALEIFFALSNRRVFPSWHGIFVFGVLEILMGLMFMLRPPEAIFAFTMFVGFWLLSRGMLLVLIALDLDTLGFSPDWIIFLFGGILTTGLGLGVFLQSDVSFRTVVIWTGLAMIWTGIFPVLYSFKVKKARLRTGEISRQLSEDEEILKAVSKVSKKL